MKRMVYRNLGASGLKVSVLGIGCSRLGSFLSKGSETEIAAMLEEAVASGINFFDTSDIYGQGDSERLLGKTFRSKRDKVIFETKAGNCFSQAARVATCFKTPIRAVLKHLPFLKKKVQKVRASQLAQNFDPGYLETAVEASLRRLQTDYIDVFMLHSPPSRVIEEGAFLGLADRLKQSGKIRCFGISCDTGRDALLCLKYSGIDAIQVPVNDNEHVILNEVLPLAVSRNVGVVARSPFSSGSIFTNVNAPEQAPNKDVRFTAAQAALLSAASRPGVSVVIAGVSNRKHLRENILPFAGETTVVQSTG
jgi:aryl-alcohol dehydrogenase-like predicted oxidoreductase